MTNEQIAENNGWTIVCESPLELSHTDGSFASGVAADVLLSAMPDMYPEEEPEGLKTYYFSFDSGYVGGSGVVIAEDRQKAWELTLDKVVDESNGLTNKHNFKQEDLILVEPNECVIISNGDY